MTDPSTPEEAAFADFLHKRLGGDQTLSSPSDTSENSSSELLAAIRALVAQENKSNQDPGALFGAFIDAQLRKGKKTL